MKVDGRGRAAGSKRTQFGSPERESAAPVNGLSAVASGGASLYDDMLHVRTRPKSEDRTEGQRDCRKWKTKDLKGFMAKFADLEKVVLSQAKSVPGGRLPTEEILKDEGAERVDALIEQLLTEANIYTKVGTRVADAWGSLSAEARQTILAIVDAAPTSAQPASGGTPG
jgi:hypothetical protein